MTSRTSFFNAGIFRMTVKRFLWGAVAYFFGLFMTCTFPVLMRRDDWTESMVQVGGRESILMDNGGMYLTLVAAVIVPIVVAMLLFRCIHDKKQNVFVGSLPVSRTSYYVSSLAGGFVLMALPILANGLLLMLIGLSKPIMLPLSATLAWMGTGLAMLFVMFAFAVLSATLTGNSAMAAFFYGFLQALPLLVALALTGVGAYFVEGCPVEGELLSTVLRYMPICWFFSHGNTLFEPSGLLMLGVYLLGAAALYVLAGVLYGIRRSEKTGDVTVFRFLNPFLKYFITLCSALFMLALYSTSEPDSGGTFLVVSLIVTAVTCFACEMILKKSVKVFKTSYKGYFGFLVVTVAVVCVVAFTGLFGYSRYIPKEEDVAWVTMDNGRYYPDGRPTSSEEGAIRYVLKEHEKFADEAHPFDRLKDVHSGKPGIYVRYGLKNGKTLTRYFYLSDLDRVLDYERELFAYPDYKKLYINGAALDWTRAKNLYLYSAYDKGNRSMQSRQEIKALMDIYQREVLTLTYDEYCRGDDAYYVDIEMAKGEKGATGDFLRGTQSWYTSFFVNKSCRETVAWIDDYFDRTEPEYSDYYYYEVYEEPQAVATEVPQAAEPEE